MKRIALLLFLVFSLVTCNNPMDPDVGPNTKVIETKEISLKIHVPPKSISTYAEEDASYYENLIDSIIIFLYEGASTIAIDTSRFGILDIIRLSGDSIYQVNYEVDNITDGNNLRADVFANRERPLKITTEITPPGQLPLDRDNYFYMSGQVVFDHPGATYEGEVHVIRNVAKLRILVTRNNMALPDDLDVDYENVKVQIINTTDSTNAFGAINPSGIGYIAYPEHTSTALRRGAGFDDNALNYIGKGGQIDSLYLYENYRSTFGSGDTTQIKLTIPTRSKTNGNKVATKTYSLETALTGYSIKRNHIYTLVCDVRGQELGPIIEMTVQPWDDDPMEGSIYGTYLDLDVSDINFNSNTGVATINYCTDAQAIYFDFSAFNNSNSAQIRNEIKTIGIDTSLNTFPLAPDGFQDAQIIIDQQHCGSFGFQLDPGAFSDFSSVTFSGNICIKAGNIVKCLTFPARLIFDAHYIVGDTIFPGELFTEATVIADSTWIEVSPVRLWTNAAGSSYSGAASQLFLHLDENLTGISREGIISLENGAKKIYITQLPAIYVGKFGYNPATSSDDSIYTAELYTEQLKEYGTIKPLFSSSFLSVPMSANALYNGRFSALNSAVYNSTYYNDGSFNYRAALYEAINYCAYKNRPSSKTGTTPDIKWYLPSQAQLMGMWLTFESYKDSATTNFFQDISGTKTFPDIFWCSTNNSDYPWQSQYLDFRYGNVGHYNNTQGNWVRCVRDGSATGSNMVIAQDTLSNSVYFPRLRFDYGMPNGVPGTPPVSYTLFDKNGWIDHESSAQNRELYMGLRVAKHDLGSIPGVPGSGALVSWAPNICSTYSHPDDPSPSGEVWRLPTQRELQAIWIFQREMQSVITDGTFEPLSDNYYWSGTEASTTSGSNVWTVYGSGSRVLLGGAGNTPHQLKVTPLRVRCVSQYVN